MSDEDFYSAAASALLDQDHAMPNDGETCDTCGYSGDGEIRLHTTAASVGEVKQWLSDSRTATQTHAFINDGADACIACKLPEGNMRHGGWHEYTVRWTQTEVYEAVVIAHDEADALARHQVRHVDSGHTLTPVSNEWSDATITRS